MTAEQLHSISLQLRNIAERFSRAGMDGMASAATVLANIVERRGREMEKRA